MDVVMEALIYNLQEIIQWPKPFELHEFGRKI